MYLFNRQKRANNASIGALAIFLRCHRRACAGVADLPPTPARLHRAPALPSLSSPRLHLQQQHVRLAVTGGDDERTVPRDPRGFMPGQAQGRALAARQLGRALSTDNIRLATRGDGELDRGTCVELGHVDIAVLRPGGRGKR
eukprot:scaffold415_cov124-Isochrysis_galbana.AAC.1